MGRKEGYGEYEWSNRNKYRGYWKDNKLCGLGVYYYVDGKKYVGEYDNNMKEGKGKYFWPDGKQYFGQFSQDKKEGIGKYIWNDGRVYLGFWKGNKQSGLGRYTNANENKDKFGIWVEGKRTHWVDEESLKDELYEYYNEYQQILSFERDYNWDDIEEEKIVQDLEN